MSQKEALLRALEIIDENEELYYRLWATEVEKISDHIGLRKIRDADGEWQLDIVVGVDATKHELTQNLGTILDKQNQLAKAQGVDLTEYFSELLRAKLEGEYTQEYKMVAVEGGIESKPIKKSPSWNLLAWDANFDLLLFLIGMSKPKQNNINILYGYLFRALLKSFGFSEFDIDTWREFGFDQLGENICPWDICVQPIHR
jgi:hypothetical protein